MKVGTRSVLFGAHAFWIHPFFIALGWWRLYGFPFDPRLWVAFFVHDLGYLGKPNMDGEEGERHPEVGASIMRWLFDSKPYDYEYREWYFANEGVPWRAYPDKFNALLLEGWEAEAWLDNFVLLKRPRYRWSDFCLLHSRYYSKRLGRKVSPLCHADKMVIVLEPSWLYLPRVWLSGELAEFVEVARRRSQTVTGPSDPLTRDEREGFASANPWRWHRAIKSYMSRWIAAHVGGADDTWTRVRTKSEVAS